MTKRSVIASNKFKSILVRGTLSVLLGIALVITGMSGNLWKNRSAEMDVHAEATLSNPRIVSDSSMTAGQKVTWDCIWFGSYPQTEIVDTEETCGTCGKAWKKSSDYEVADSLYNQLERAVVWDNNGDLTLNGKKYRRIKKSDATYEESYSPDYYAWKDSDSYHYFRYDKIKWRVLNVSGNRALLLADQALDDQQYNKTETSVTWAGSTIRSWLNGYGVSENVADMNFTGKSFTGSAFSTEELRAIDSTILDNQNTGPNSGSNGGDNTVDQVFLLASYDLYHDDASASFGFYKEDNSKYDEARRCTSSTYAKAMGTRSNGNPEYFGNCKWWLRSPGDISDVAAFVYDDGNVCNIGNVVHYDDYGVRPALNLNLSSSDLWSFAGTVCSNGTVKEDIGSATCTLNKEDYPYTGKSIIPDVTVTFEGKTLTPGTDYTVTSESRDAGKAVATISGKGNYTGTKSVTFRISPASLAGKKLTLSKATYTYNTKVQKPAVKTVGGKPLKSGTDFTVKITNSKGKAVASPKAAGTYTLAVTGKGNYTGTSAKATYKINKAANPLTIKAKTATVKYKAVKAKNQTLAVTKVLAFKKKGQGKKTYTKASGSKKISINKKTGKVTIKKGLKKGTYKVKVKVKAAGNANYKALTRTTTFTIKIS